MLCGPFLAFENGWKFHSKPSTTFERTECLDFLGEKKCEGVVSGGQAIAMRLLRCHEWLLGCYGRLLTGPSEKRHKSL